MKEIVKSVNKDVCDQLRKAHMRFRISEESYFMDRLSFEYLYKVFVDFAELFSSLERDNDIIFGVVNFDIHIISGLNRKEGTIKSLIFSKEYIESHYKTNLYKTLLKDLDESCSSKFEYLLDEETKWELLNSTLGDRLIPFSIGKQIYFDFVKNEFIII